jgi:hypothetical protein
MSLQLDERIADLPQHCGRSFGDVICPKCNGWGGAYVLVTGDYPYWWTCDWQECETCFGTGRARRINAPSLAP